MGKIVVYFGEDHPQAGQIKESIDTPDPHVPTPMGTDDFNAVMRRKSQRALTRGDAAQALLYLSKLGG